MPFYIIIIFFVLDCVLFGFIGFCGTVVPAPVFSSGSSMNILFHTDHINGGEKGSEIHWSSVSKHNKLQNWCDIIVTYIFFQNVCKIILGYLKNWQFYSITANSYISFLEHKNFESLISKSNLQCKMGPNQPSVEQPDNILGQ